MDCIPRSLGAVVLAGLVTASGCAYAGASLELQAGGSRLTPADDADPMAQTGLGWHLGLSAALEFDVVRGSAAAGGLGFQHTTLPADASGARPTTPSFFAQYWLTSAIDRLGNDDLRPRVLLGLELGQSSSTGMGALYGAVGASWHPRPGTAWHVYVGPQLMAVDSSLGYYYGVGATLRLRYRRAFFAACDLTPSEAARQLSAGPTRLECR